MVQALAYFGTFILGVLTLFQIALVFGAPLGKYAWGGAHDVLPLKLRIASALSICLYIFFAVVLLDKAGSIELLPGAKFVDITIWILAGYFVLGVFMNAISRSKPECYVMTPVALLLATVFLAAARS